MAAPSIALPATPPSPSSPSSTSSLPSSSPSTYSVNGNDGKQLDDIHVQCPDADTYQKWFKCYNDNASAQCDSKELADRKACSNLWQVMCGMHYLSPVLLPHSL
ncbi:hypothetical protein F4804DRAFT_331854 [Jackrogersella minutella]|nr:hypothetical protein F4804DRAFT_331854 [Jackrogersella minutella]